MNHVPKACLDCGEPTLNGNLCPAHRRARGVARNAKATRKAYRDPIYLSMKPNGQICHLCGKPGADTRDHLVPISKGGTVADGVLPAHRSCNSARGNRS